MGGAYSGSRKTGDTSGVTKRKRLARDEKKSLSVVLVAFGISPEAGKKYAADHALDSTIPLVVSNEVALRYEVSIAPYGLLVDREGILRAKGLVNTLTDIESLLNAEQAGVRSIDEFLKRKKAAQPS